MKLPHLFVLALALTLLNGCATTAHDAALLGDIKTVRLALDQGQDVNAVVPEDAFGSLLNRAIYSGDPALVSLIVERGADVNAVAGLLGGTPLHYSSMFGDDPEIPRILLAHGADVNGVNKHGWTSLHNAMLNGSPAIAELLLAHGADPRAVDHQGSTPLHFVAQAIDPSASSEDYVKMAKKLLALGGDPNAANKHGRTPLHDAATANKGSVMQLLVEGGADPSLRDVDGKSAQDLLQAKLRADRDKRIQAEQERQAKVQARKQREASAERRRHESDSGFQWGKFAALATGAAIGGIDNLDAATQAQLVGGMVSDSMPNQKGTANTQSVASDRVIAPQIQTGGGGSFQLVCNNPPTRVCAEYTFASQTDQNSFRGQCVSGGGEVLSGSCPSHPACKHSANGRTSITYAYDRGAEFISSACRDNGGEYIGASR